MQQQEHIFGSVSILQVFGEVVIQAKARAIDLHQVRGADTSIGKNEAEPIALGAGGDDIHELIQAPAFLLNLGHIDTQFFHQGLVGAQGLNGQIQGQAIGHAFQGHISDGVLVVVRQPLGIHVLGDVDGHAHVHIGGHGAGGHFRNVGCLTGLGHGGQLAHMIAPRGLDDLDGQVGVHLLEIRSPGLQVAHIVTGNGGRHDHNGVLLRGFRFSRSARLGGGLCRSAVCGARVVLRTTGNQAANHCQAQKQC